MLCKFNGLRQGRLRHELFGEDLSVAIPLNLDECLQGNEGVPLSNIQVSPDEVCQHQKPFFHLDVLNHSDDCPLCPFQQNFLENVLVVEKLSTLVVEIHLGVILALLNMLLVLFNVLLLFRGDSNVVLVDDLLQSGFDFESISFLLSVQVLRRHIDVSFLGSFSEVFEQLLDNEFIKRERVSFKEVLNANDFLVHAFLFNVTNLLVHLLNQR